MGKAVISCRRPILPIRWHFSTSLPAEVVPDNDKSFTGTLVHSSLSSGPLDYCRGWAWQQIILSRRLDARRNATRDDVHGGDCVLLLEHKPVYTLGRGADETHLTFLKDDVDGLRERLARSNRGIGSARLSIDRRMDDSFLQCPISEAVSRLADVTVPVVAPNQVPIYRVDRGGEVTFHGPGQLVVYPLLDLRCSPYKQDLHWYLRMIEEVVLRALRRYDIDAYRDADNTGVWVGDEKVAAVGVSSSRWITTHGFALNVSPNLDYFDTSMILPCGIEGKGVTSIEKILKERGTSTIPTMEEVASTTLELLQEVFDVPVKQTQESFALC